MDIVQSRADLVSVLQAAEVNGHPLRVVLDLGDINTPCAFVQLDTIDHYLAGGEIVWRVYLVGDFTDQERVVEQLEQLLNSILTLGISPAAPTEYVGLPVPEQSQALPALLVRISETV